MVFEGPYFPLGRTAPVYVGWHKLTNWSFAHPSRRGESWKSHFTTVVVFSEGLVLLSAHVVSCNLVVSHPSYLILVFLLWWCWYHSHIIKGFNCVIFLIFGVMPLFGMCRLVYIFLWVIWLPQTLSGPRFYCHWRVPTWSSPFLFFILDVFYFWSKCPNAVDSDLGRCLLTFSSGIMGQVARLPPLMDLLRVYGVGMDMSLCRNFTTSFVVPSILLTLLWVPSFLIVLTIILSSVYSKVILHNPVCFSRDPSIISLPCLVNGDIVLVQDDFTSIVCY